MKKHLLIAMAATMATNMVFAATDTDKHVVLENVGVCNMSPDGTTIVGYMYGTTVIYDMESGKTYTYDDENLYYGPGTGNAVSNNGIVVGQEMMMYASWWKDGQWHAFEDIADKMGLASGVTADGSRMVGSVAPDSYAGDFEGTMLVPCYWDVAADGTVSATQLLPHPEVDLTGRSPQYITALCVSDDGKTIAGQIVDYAGNIVQPIVYTQDESGEWSYDLIHNDMFHPEDITMPEWPGEEPQTDPKYYMDLRAREAYEKAYEAWQESGYQASLYPEPENYMTAEQIASWKDAEERSEDYYQKFLAFDAAYQKLYRKVPSFGFNNVFLSAEGKTYATTLSKEGAYMTENAPYMFNLVDNTFTAYPADQHVILTAMGENGVLLAQSPANDFNACTTAFILPENASQFVSLYDYMRQANPELGSWMTQNLSHTIEYNGMNVEAVTTGMPFCNRDLSVIGLMVENEWDFTNGVLAYSYILSNDSLQGVCAPSALQGNLAVKALPGGILQMSGDVASAIVYNLAGSAVFAVDSPSSSIATGLPCGMYIVKATAVDGSVATSKVSF